MKVTIDLDEIGRLAEQGGRVILSPEGEEALVRLLEAQAAIDEAVDEAKRRLEAAALELNPNFSCLRSDSLTVYYRASGARYRLDEGQVESLPPGLYEARTSYTALASEIDRYRAQQGSLPPGINEVARRKQIVFSRRSTADGEA